MRPLSDEDGGWAEVCEVHEHTPGGTSGGRCPAAARLRWSNPIFLQIKGDGAGSRIYGTLCLKEEEDSGVAWCVFEPPEQAPQASAKYAISTRLTDIHSIRIIRPSMGYPQIILNLRSGCSPAPLYFHSGGVQDFRTSLSDFVALSKCERDPGLLLVNDTSDKLNRSLSHLEMVDTSPAARSRATTKPSTPSACDDDEDDEGRLVVGGGEWKWRALQGGVSVMRGLRTGWAKASAAAMDVASNAAELLDADAGVTEEQHRNMRLGLVLTPPPPPAPVLPPGLLEGLWLGGEEGVLVEAEGVPFAQQPPVERAEFNSWFDAMGRLRDADMLRRRAYFGGLSDGVRREAWKFLLGCYPANSTSAQRHELLQRKRKEYMLLQGQWKSITPEQEARFAKFRDRKNRIEKDVVRTDRQQPLFAEDGAEGLQSLRRILLTYTFYNFDLSYCQGMSDLAAPLLVVMEEEVEAFWCFQTVMDQVEGNFHKDQIGMHTQLQALDHLCKVVEPELHAYLAERECSNFYFCFRWLLILYKREFWFRDVLRVWEALFSRVRGDRLHLFMAIGILGRHKKQIMGQKMGFDDILKYVNGLASKMDWREVLADADAAYMRHKQACAEAS
mmetsp:Transcript_43171/g.105608  ORF Transcript_43171/g.105608 Transcript_43171/m.105608 type:complete len:614 (-) Transcript_43171:10-1851(-)